MCSKKISVRFLFALCRQPTAWKSEEIVIMRDEESKLSQKRSRRNDEHFTHVIAPGCRVRAESDARPPVRRHSCLDRKVNLIWFIDIVPRQFVFTFVITSRWISEQTVTVIAFNWNVQYFFLVKNSSEKYPTFGGAPGKWAENIKETYERAED